MSNDSASRRAWIKNAAIIFLVILLLLTFFSNTILNYSLPEVSAQYTSSGTLSTAIKASGTVKANASYNVVYEADAADSADGVAQTRKVLSVFVKEGQTVEKDAPILELKGGASEQLKSAQDEYDKLKREYDLAVIGDTVSNLTSDKTISDAQKTLADAKDELAKLQKNYNDLLSGVDTTTILQNQISAVEDAIENLTEQQTEMTNKITEVNAIISEAKALIDKDVLSNQTVAEKLAAAEEEYNSISSEYDTLKKETDFYKERLDEIKKVSGDVTEANKLTQQLKTLRNSLSDLKKEITRYDIDTQEELKKLEAAIPNEIEILIDSSDETETDSNNQNGYNEAKEAYDKALKDYTRKMQDYAAQVKSLEDQIEELEAKLNVIGMPEVDDIFDYTVDYDLASAQKDYDEASAKLTELETKYTDAKTKYESLIKQNSAEDTVNEYSLILETYKNEESSLKDTIKQKNKELDNLKKQLSDSTTDLTPEALADKIKEQKNSVDSLEAALKITQATENQTTTTNKLTREDQKKQLEELAAKIETYKNAPENTQVTAPIAGKITAINFTAGESVTSGNTVASIEIADKGYIVEISMAADQARKIQVGTPCSVVNSWWYSNIEASVTGMRSDPSSQGKNRIITITVSGDVSEGQTLNFSIGDKSQSYDSVLPNSAIREDNDGKFVLVVESKKTPLNMRYTAKRVDIEVLASDDTQSAVSGLYGSEFVITNSTVPIADKQQVRLAEN
ncbi:MAG: HlyD family efflux transporter periplasmic adaptor subunit [Clostridia bacterium]|nr:HlyD family efflux transporter periplasmic adaptor subunit [Clostridia bacterium]